MYHWKICSSIQWAVFYFVDGFLCCAKNLLVWCSSICLFLFFSIIVVVFLTWGDTSKILLREMSENLLPLFSFTIVIILSLIFKSLIHFEFILVYGVRRCSGFIFGGVCPIFQHHLLNRLSLSQCILLSPLSNINWPYKHEFFSELSILFVLYACFYASTMLFWLLWPCSIVWYQVAWFLQLCSFFSRLIFAIQGFLWFYINFWKYLFWFCGIHHWYLDRNCIETIDCLGSMDILMMLILPIHEHGIYSHLFVSSSISVFNVLEFSEYRSFTSLVKFIPRYFLMQL